MLEGIQINNIRTTAIDQDIDLITVQKAPHTLYPPQTLKLSFLKIFKCCLHINKCIAIRFLLQSEVVDVPSIYNAFDHNYVFFFAV